VTLIIAIGQIFGPVLSVGKFKTEDEAVALANDTTYGLGAGLHSSTLARFPHPSIVFDLILFHCKMTPINVCVFHLR
jgi:hypothetical protein